LAGAPVDDDDDSDVGAGTDGTAKSVGSNGTGAINISALDDYGAGKWGRYLRAPDFYFDIMRALFAVRPLISSDGAGPLIFSIVIMLVMLVALYNINTAELVGERSRLLAQSRRWRIIGWVLALAAIVERLAMMLMPGSTIGFGDITPIT
jgi:hypothetical protein